MNHLIPVGVAKDYKGREIKVGDYARSIESGWAGRIEEMNEDRYQIDGDRWDTSVMCRMMGVYELALMIGGAKTVEEALCEDDVQWFAASDILKIGVKTEAAWPPDTIGEGAKSDPVGEEQVRSR